MRVIGEIPHPNCKITLFSWNNRYLVKLEQGYLEQTYKIDQFEVSGDEGLIQIINEPFIEQALKIFDEMNHAWSKAIREG
ncbi:MAG: hypothetical protein JNM57_04395 [Cyclobacteriaceae bacterium]|nr:hypothetical protein [Cyclobacteriaceae bacterium]